MVLADRIKAFGRLGDIITGLPHDELEVMQEKATRENPWFTSDSVAMALNGITRFLGEPVLHRWTSSYTLERQQPNTIGVAMAGNIPLVRLHDFLCVLNSCNRLKTTLSSQESFLICYLFPLLP